MSYLVLARKWRPRTFAELVGQEHVLRALMNALDSGRVHHAFLFTGTRGVGKTTIARILAKSLNCERGMSSKPCGECSACQEIDEGRFVDLWEVDAASRTRVDDTRELLDNVQYAPARGRYKVYLIDEVHMLSTHSFNALLKTLEEPPPRVKFLLATTDPQKLPVTVLSRCLQFNLKRLPTPAIAERLTSILAAEGITAESAAVQLVARAAEGSMRDALSLLDQLIAFGGGALTGEDARSMLGTLDRSYLFKVLAALAGRDARALLQCVAELDERVPEYEGVLNELATILQRLALLQAVPDLQPDEGADLATLTELAQQLSPEDVQLFYQIAIIGRRDLGLAPDPRSGFEMVLLRMLSFQFAPADTERAPRAAAAVRTPALPATASSAPSPPPAASQSPMSSPASTPNPSPSPTPSATSTPSPAPTAATDTDWSRVVSTLGLQGPVSQLAAHCSWVKETADRIHLLLDADGEHYRRPALEEKLRMALSGHFGRDVKLDIALATAAVPTPARQQRAQADARQREAQVAIDNDPNVRAMRDTFGAKIQSESVRPAD